MRGERRISVVQDGAAVLKGERSAFKKTWNPVKIGNKTIIIEKKSPPKSEGRFPLEDILLNQLNDLQQLYEKNKDDKVLKKNIQLLRKKLES